MRTRWMRMVVVLTGLTTLFTSADTFTHTAEPMIGVYFRR
jgi:hypothetical protein